MKDNFRIYVAKTVQGLQYLTAHWGSRFVGGAIGLFSDSIAEGSRQAFLQALPAHPQQWHDSIEQLAKDRGFWQFRNETHESLATRLLKAWSLYEMGGTPQALRQQIDEWGTSKFGAGWLNDVSISENPDPFVFEFTATVGSLPSLSLPTYGSGLIYGQTSEVYGFDLEDNRTQLLRIVRKLKPARSKEIIQLTTDNVSLLPSFESPPELVNTTSGTFPAVSGDLLAVDVSDLIREDSVAYQWLDTDGTDIPGETAATYTVDTAETGDGVSCRATATNANGSTSAVTAERAVEEAPPDPILALGPVAYYPIHDETFVTEDGSGNAEVLADAVDPLDNTRWLENVVAGDRPEYLASGTSLFPSGCRAVRGDGVTDALTNTTAAALHAALGSTTYTAYVLAVKVSGSSTQHIAGAGPSSTFGTSRTRAAHTAEVLGQQDSRTQTLAGWSGGVARWGRFEFSAGILTSADSAGNSVSGAANVVGTYSMSSLFARLTSTTEDQHSDAEIAAWVVFDRVLDAGEQATVEAELVSIGGL